MDYTKTQLYGLTSIEEAKSLLEIEKPICFKPRCYVLDEKRLIEEPSKETKKVHEKIKRHLEQLDIPSYVFSQKGTTHIKEVKAHTPNSFFFITDIKGFYPNTHRDKVYSFFKEKLKQTSAVAKFLTDITTVNIEKIHVNHEVKELIDEKGFCKNHLITGASCSTLLAFLANIDMFESLIQTSKEIGIRATIYVDDLAFSSRKPIPFSFKQTVRKTLFKNGYKASDTKTFSNKKKGSIKIHGIYINNGKLSPSNKMIKEQKELARSKTTNLESLKRGKGIQNYTTQILRNN